MVATNLNQLNQQLLNKLQSAMVVVSAKVSADMYQETRSFYTQGKPRIYVRTGALGDSPRTTSLNSVNTGTGGSVSFEAYLQENDYPVPNTAFTNRGYSSHFSGKEVLEAAENHTAHILGKPGFWQRSEKKFQKELDATIRQFFK